MEFSYLCKRNEVDGFGKLFKIQKSKSCPKQKTFIVSVNLKTKRKFNIIMEIKNFTITKRDGSKDRFSLDKIMNAITKAFESVDEPADLGTVSKIISHLDIKDDIKVEDIQNQVEEALMREGFYKVAKSFILYRQEHTEDRETLEKMMFLSEYMESVNAATGSKYDANANV